MFLAYMSETWNTTKRPQIPKQKQCVELKFKKEKLIIIKKKTSILTENCFFNKEFFLCYILASFYQQFVVQYFIQNNQKLQTFILIIK